MPELKKIPPKDELQDCKDEGMTLEEISSIYEVSVSTVKRWVRSYGLASRKKKAAPVMKETISRPHETLLDRAKSILGNRLTDHRIRGYILDGRPIKSDDVVRAAGLTPKEI